MTTEIQSRMLFVSVCLPSLSLLRIKVPDSSSYIPIQAVILPCPVLSSRLTLHANPSSPIIPTFIRFQNISCTVPSIRHIHITLLILVLCPTIGPFLLRRPHPIRPIQLGNNITFPLRIRNILTSVRNQQRKEDRGRGARD